MPASRIAHKRLGKLPWKDLVEPAVQLARNGFELDAYCAHSLNEELGKSLEFAEFRRVYSKPDGGPWQKGDKLVQPDLAATLVRIAENGAAGFYSGPVADSLLAEMGRGGGLIVREDLAGYRAIERKPIHGVYRGHDIYCMPPSSSGGTTLVEELNILENFDLRKQERWSRQTIHLMAEAARRAYRDRACYLGDPSLIEYPTKLIDKDYARTLAAGIDLNHATPSAELAGEIKLSGEGEHTTHFSVIDAAGMAVSMTYTLEDGYGSRVVVKGAGFLLNDEMNDFNWFPGVTDTKGHIGTLPNQIQPGKRMLSSMCPTIVAKDGKPLLITGSPGGRTIINTVLCMVVNVVDFDMNPRDAVDAPRIHHQWLPDRLQVEPALWEQHPELQGSLVKLGHKFAKPILQGDAHTIWIDPKTGEQIGVADHRLSGKAASSK